MNEFSSTSRRSPRFAMAAVLVLGAVAIGLRFRNAWVYPLGMGFDAQGNWAYIDSLRSLWVLPDPETTWSAAHPPFFYALSAALSFVLGHPEPHTVVIATRFFSTAVGLGAIVAIMVWVRRFDPSQPERAWLSGALLLFLPVHIYMSAMLSEEILVSSLRTFVVLGVLTDLKGNSGVGRAWIWGGLAGLALLTKLSGLLLVIAAGGAYLLAGWTGRGVRWGAVRGLALGLGAFCTGGWFYVYRWWTRGYFYPSGLEVHRIMFEMPPGQRTLSDYFSFPFSSLTGSDLLTADLIHSVWGSTYATIWFDGHRHFLPLEAPGLMLAGGVIGFLGLIPTVAFFIGSVRGARRMLKKANPIDGLLLGLIVFNLAGYALFTWRNPWFATLKGSYLLGLIAPFAIYASESLSAGWRFLRDRAQVGASLGAAGLLILWITVTLTFASEGVFSKREYPGLDWRRASPNRPPLPDEENERLRNSPVPNVHPR